MFEPSRAVQTGAGSFVMGSPCVASRLAKSPVSGRMLLGSFLLCRKSHDAPGSFLGVLP